VPGHPTQLPVGDERYGLPPHWPKALRPPPADVAELEQVVDRARHRFTDRWNTALSEIAPDAPPVDDAFRVHGHRVLYNSPIELQGWARRHDTMSDHRYVGPLVRDQIRPPEFDDWTRVHDAPKVYVALGTFLSHRSDVLARLATALRRCGARAAIATGPADPVDLGPVPDDWLVAPTLPQVALLAHADLAIHHGGNNSVQESLAAGVRQLVLPFSTDQFANAFDLERTGRGVVAPPNTATPDELAVLVGGCLADARPAPITRPDADALAAALGGPAPIPA
jgi:UDP:flavonoid glycosyltransferase YjiC (YdhE family)